MNRMPQGLLLRSALIVFLGACASGPDRVEADRDGRDQSYLHNGPTTRLEDLVRPQDQTALSLLQEKTEDLLKQKKRVDELEADATKHAAEMDRVKGDFTALQKEKENLQSLLNEAADRERTAMEQALTAQVAKLKLEQELLKLRLGELVKEVK